MARVSFAQNFEDIVLWRALRDVRWGRYLDVGAQDPVVDSVSQSFYREGWRGISAEPNPAYAQALRDDRPDEEVVEAAVGSASEPITFFVVPNTGLSTSDAALAETYRQQDHAVHSVTVPVVPLSDLLARFAGAELHWLKIDVEGMERDVLESWGEAVVRPWIVVIESIDPVTQEDNAALWRELVEARHYHEVLFDGVSRYFVADEHAELDRFLGAPANSLDEFSVPAHHWCAANAAHFFRTLLAEAEGRATEVPVLQTALDESWRLIGERDTALAAAATALTATEAEVSLKQALLEERERALQAFAGIVAAQREDNARQAALLARAEGLLAQAEDLAGPWRQRLFNLLRPGRRSRVLRLRGELAAWSQVWRAGATTNHSVQPREGRSMDMFAYDDRDPYHRADNLAELCRFADLDFIRCAFVTMLGRQSDPDGEAHFLACLRRGDTKLSILRALRLSDEGRRHDPGIAGLDRALKRDRAARRRWTGWLVRLFTGAEGNSAVERQLRSLRNAVEAERQMAARRAALLATGQEHLTSEMRQVQSLVRSGISGISAARITQAEGGGEESWERVLGSFLHG